MALLDNTAHAMYAAAHGMSSMTSQYHVNLMNSRIMASAAAASSNGGASDAYSGSNINETSPNQPSSMNLHSQNYSPLSTNSSRHASQSRLNVEADIRIGVGTPRAHLHNDTPSTQSPPPQSNASSSTEHNENLSSSLEDSSPNSIINNNSSNNRRKRRYDGDHSHHELGMTMNLKLEPASSLISSPNPASLASSLHHAFKPIFRPLLICCMHEKHPFHTGWSAFTTFCFIKILLEPFMTEYMIKKAHNHTSLCFSKTE